MPNEKKEIPLTFKRSVSQGTAFTLFHLMAIFPASAQEKIHFDNLREAILKLFPEGNLDAKFAAKDSRTIEIDRRQMRAIIYGAVALILNLDAKQSHMEAAFGVGVYSLGTIKTVCNKIGIWPQVVALIKPETAAEWDGEMDETEGLEGLEEGSTGANDAPAPPADAPAPKDGKKKGK